MEFLEQLLYLLSVFLPVGAFFALGLAIAHFVWGRQTKALRTAHAENLELNEELEAIRARSQRLALHAVDLIAKPTTAKSIVIQGSPSESDMLAVAPLLGPLYTRCPNTVDDLKRINGIGRKLEARLHDAGVYRFWQIAEWTPEAVAHISKKFSLKGRVESEDWLEQAAQLNLDTPSDAEADSPTS